MSQEGTIPEPQPRRVPIPPREERGSGVTAALLSHLGPLSPRIVGPGPGPSARRLGPGPGLDPDPDHLINQNLPMQKTRDDRDRRVETMDERRETGESISFAKLGHFVSHLIRN